LPTIHQGFTPRRRFNDQRIYESIHSHENFEHKGSFEGWIRRIMINECISYIRAQKKVSFLEDEYYREDSFNNIENNLNVEDIQFLIDSLPDGYKMIFNLTR
jgi:RNA polymerase sigma-70 factor (ECF subfamily)